MSEIIEDLVAKIAELENRLEYIEAVEKNVFSTVTVSGLSTLSGGVQFGRTTAQITGGVISATGRSTVRLTSQVATDPDDLDTINDGVDGQVLILAARNATETITVKDATGNIFLAGGADRTLFKGAGATDTLMLTYDNVNSQWLELSYSNN